MEDIKGNRVYIRTIRGEYVCRKVIDVMGSGKKRKLVLSGYSEPGKELKIREKDIEWIKIV